LTDYSDVPQVNALHQERELVTSAITMIDDGGNMTFFTIEPAPPDPNAAVRVTMPPPTPAGTLADVRAWLVSRQNDLDQQLADLGVTNPPAKNT